MVHEFETLNQAASALLVETYGLLNGRGLRSVVAGGWVPGLWSTGSDLFHPGARDVESLAESDNPTLRPLPCETLKN